MQVNYPPNNFSYFGTQTPGLIGQQKPLPTLSADSGDFTDLNSIQQGQQLAAQALQEGSSMAPAQGGFVTGLARLAEAVSGGMQLHTANDKLAKAKEHNAQVMRDALNSGDWSKLATSDNEQANKLGDALLQSQLKHMQTERLLTAPELSSAGFPNGTVATRGMNGEIKVLSRPNQTLPKGWSYDESGTPFIVPGGPADPKILAQQSGAKRKPTASKPDESGVLPWLRKW